VTKIEDRDPMLASTEAGEDKGTKKKAGRGIILALAGFCIMAFVIYLSMIAIMTTQSS
jgi:hypothetical protein